MLIIGMVLLNYTNPLPLFTCVLVLLGSIWSQSTEGLDILKKFELLSFGLVILGILFLIGLLIEEFLFNKNEPATLTAIFKMLTTSSHNEKIITKYELMLCFVNSLVFGFLGSFLKNNKADVVIWIIVYVCINLWGAERSQTAVYSGSFFSYIIFLI